MQQQLDPCPRLHLTSPCPPDQPALLPYLHILAHSPYHCFLCAQRVCLVLVSCCSRPSRSATSPCPLSRSCSLTHLAFACWVLWPSMAIPSTAPMHPLLLLHAVARGACGADIAKPFGGLRALHGKEEGSSVDLWGGGGEQPDNPLRIINISPLNTFLRITFVLLCPVAADRALLIALVSPPFSGPCWERSLSGAELAILRQAIVSVQGKN